MKKNKLKKILASISKPDSGVKEIFKSAEREMEKVADKLREDAEIKTVDIAKKRISEIKEQIQSIFDSILNLKRELEKSESELTDDLNKKLSSLKSMMAEHRIAGLERLGILSEEMDVLKDEIQEISQRKVEIPKYEIQIEKVENDLKSEMKRTTLVSKQENEKQLEKILNQSEKDIALLREELKNFKRDTMSSMANRGGSMPRQININSSLMSTRYSDINFIPGSALGISNINNDSSKRVDITISAIPSSVASGIIGGANTNIQYNNGGLFGGDANLTWDLTNQRLSLGIASGSTAALAITPKVATDRALLLKGFTSQSGDYILAQNSAGTDIFKVNSVGSVFSKTTANNTGYFIRNQADTLDVVVMGHDTSNGDLQIGGGGAFNGIWLISNSGLFVNGAAQVGVGRRANDYVSNFQVYSKANGTIAMTLMKKAGTQTADMLRFLDDSFNVLGGFNKNYSFLAAQGTTAAASAPIKFTSGTNMTTAEAGSIEFTTDDLFFTITTGAARKAFILDDGTRLTSGNLPIATTNGRLINANITASATSFEFNPTFADTDFNVSGNTISMLHLDANGAVSWFRPDSDSTTAFEFRDAAGNTDMIYDSTSPLFTFNTDIVISGKITNYKSALLTGYGVPIIPGYARPAAGQTAAVASVAAYSNTAADGTYEVSANVLVTASGTHNFTVTVAYTDESNTARTLTLPFSSLAGAVVTAITNTAGATAYEGLVCHIRVKASTTITIATVGVFTSVTYNCEGTIKRIA